MGLRPGLQRPADRRAQESAKQGAQKTARPHPAVICGLRFVWGGRRHEVKRVNLVFERKNGGRKYLCFVVDTGGMVAELAFDRQDLGFSITNVESTF